MALDAADGRALAVPAPAWFRAASSVINQWRALELESLRAIEQHAHDAARTAGLLVWLVIAVAALLLGVAALIAWRTGSAILRVALRVTARTEEVREALLVPMQHALSRLADGDFGGRMDGVVDKLSIESGDELGIMARSVDGMIDAARATTA